MPSERVLSPRVLLLASRHDLTCDYVVAALRSRGASYLRLNTEDLPHFELCLDPATPILRGVSPELMFEIRGEDLDAVYFRQPTFLREAFAPGCAPEERFRRVQWASFMRNLMVFDRCLWINHPSRTYEAEHKAFQLRAAAEIGFHIPRTTISNSAARSEWVAGTGDTVAVKGLDTVLLRDVNREIFGYTNLIPPAEIGRHELQSAPMILQEGLLRKVDLRVTVVAEDVWGASVMERGEPIIGDWRLAKSEATFAKVELPPDIIGHCTSVVRRLGLTFGAIDLASRRELIISSKSTRQANGPGFKLDWAFRSPAR